MVVFALMDNKKNPDHILVIDDDEVSSEVLALLLENEGFTVETVDSGDAALVRLRQTTSPSPRIVLADMQMPGITGAKLAEQLRSSGDDQMVLLAMSATRPEESALHGFKGFLLKPFTMQMLKDAVIGGPTAASGKADQANIAVLNEVVYAKLAASMRPSRLSQLYAMCLSDTEKRISVMRSAALKGDDDAYRREAHSIKGGSGMVGATELQILATSMEKRGLGDTNHVVTLDEFIVACERLRRILIARADEK